MSLTRKDHVEWNNPDTERQILHFSLSLQAHSSKSLDINKYSGINAETRKDKRGHC